MEEESSVRATKAPPKEAALALGSNGLMSEASRKPEVETAINKAKSAAIVFRIEKSPRLILFLDLLRVSSGNSLLSQNHGHSKPSLYLADELTTGNTLC
jgi:hypothetical protein